MTGISAVGCHDRCVNDGNWFLVLLSVHMLDDVICGLGLRILFQRRLPSVSVAEENVPQRAKRMKSTDLVWVIAWKHQDILLSRRE